MVVDPLQVGGLSAQTWTVVHKLAVNFASRKVDERHVLLVRTRSETYSTRAEGRPPSRRLKSRIRARFYFPRNLERQVNFSEASRVEVTLSSSRRSPCRCRAKPALLHPRHGNSSQALCGLVRPGQNSWQLFE